jgi:hypothetical protein
MEQIAGGVCYYSMVMPALLGWINLACSGSIRFDSDKDGSFGRRSGKASTVHMRNGKTL